MAAAEAAFGDDDSTALGSTAKKRSLVEDGGAPGPNGPGTLRHRGRDGHSCKLHGTKDGARDDAVPEELIFWAKPPRNGAPHGYLCLYCHRVYERRYRIAHLGGAEAFVQVCGADRSLHANFLGWRSKLIERIKARGANRSARMEWERVSQPTQTLESSKFISCKFEQPTDTVMEESDYVERFGDPHRNGPGHQREWATGATCVRRS